MALKKAGRLPQAAVLKQMLKRCSSLGRKQGMGGGGEEEGLPLDVPKGHFVVYVGGVWSFRPVRCNTEVKEWKIIPL